MSFVDRYKKAGCTKAKDVSFSNIASIAKLTVPAMVISSFQKKVGSATAPFDVFVQADADAGKARILVKKVPPADIIIEWAERSGPGPEAAKAVLKVKAELGSLAITNNTYLKEITSVKETVKGLKEEIKVLETSAPMAIDMVKLKKDIGEARQKLAQAEVSGKTIQGKHDGWYLAGPRKGIAPILTKFAVDAKTLNATDSDLFGKALHEMSQNANEVRKVYDIDIKAATDALISRLNNLESVSTKGHAEALKDVRTNLGIEVAKLRDAATKGENELKLSKTQELINQLKDPNSVAYKRLKLHPETKKGEKESNKTRLANIPKYTEMITKQVSRLKKSVPPFYANDGEVKKLLNELDSISSTTVQALTAGKLLIEQCDSALDNFV